MSRSLVCRVALWMVLSAAAVADDAPAARQKVVVLLDPSLSAAVPTLTDSFQRLGFRGVLTVDDNLTGPYDTEPLVIAGSRRSVRDWIYILELGKPVAGRGAALSGVDVNVPYMLHYRAPGEQKSVTLVRGSLYSWHNTLDAALYSFAERACSSQLGSDIRTRLGATMLTGRSVPQNNFPLTPKVWYPAVLTENGTMLKVVVRNRLPITVRYSLAIRSSLQDNREAIYPSTGSGAKYLDSGEEKEVLIPVANLAGIIPSYVACYADVVDERVVMRPGAGGAAQTRVRSRMRDEDR